MKKIYTIPYLEIIELNEEDIIVTSGETEVDPRDPEAKYIWGK